MMNSVNTIKEIQNEVRLYKMKIAMIMFVYCFGSFLLLKKQYKAQKNNTRHKADIHVVLKKIQSKSNCK